MLFISLSFISACSQINEAMVDNYSDQESLAEAYKYLDRIEQQLPDLIKTEGDDWDIHQTRMYSPVDKLVGSTCMHPYDEWVNNSLDYKDEFSGLKRAIDQRYGLHYYTAEMTRYYYEIHAKRRVYSHAQDFLIGDGTQILSIRTTIYVPTEQGCGMFGGYPNEVKRSFNMMRVMGDGYPVSIARMRQPLTQESRDTFVKLVKEMDSVKKARIQNYAKSKAEARVSAEKRNAYIEKRNRENAKLWQGHYQQTQQNVQNNMAFFADTTKYIRQHKRMTQHNDTANIDRARASNISRSQREIIQKAQVREVEKTASSARATGVYETAIDRKIVTKASKEKTKGLRYTEVSIEAKGNTSMHFPYEQALNLSETNAFNEASGMCAKSGGRLKKDSGTMAKKDCSENNNGEYKCNVTVLFTCLK